MAVNAELLALYWDIGRIVAERRTAERWGAKIIQRLAADIRNDLPEIKGFSERNLKRMFVFYNEYKELQFRPPALAQIAQDGGSSIGPPPGGPITGKGTPNARPCCPVALGTQLHAFGSEKSECAPVVHGTYS
jgi:hypothetical protein